MTSLPSSARLPQPVLQRSMSSDRFFPRSARDAGWRSKNPFHSLSIRRVRERSRTDASVCSSSCFQDACNRLPTISQSLTSRASSSQLESSASLFCQETFSELGSSSTSTLSMRKNPLGAESPCSTPPKRDRMEPPRAVSWDLPRSESAGGIFENISSPKCQLSHISSSLVDFNDLMTDAPAPDPPHDASTMALPTLERNVSLAMESTGSSSFSSKLDSFSERKFAMSRRAYAVSASSANDGFHSDDESD